ncbi:hypothetical protein CANDROIZ_40050 [Candidatus Roizmanbacteria bacterium]|nr:hypothetical protein CANDROIZ_40050 [Candidatus Roizmanbacteria bacterium]
MVKLFIKEIREIKPEPKIMKPKIFKIVPLLILIFKNGNLNKDLRLAIFFIVTI